jgi:glutathione synthase
MVQVAFVMDPIAGLNLKKDSTLAMIRSAQLRGWKIHCLDSSDLFFKDGECWGRTQSVALSDAFAESLDYRAAENSWYTVGEVREQPMSEMDVIFMRKDPPFNMNYIYATYLLERVAATTLVVNDPGSLRDCNEKFYATMFPQCCPPLIVSAHSEPIRSFQKEQGNLVLKKLDGMGGSSVFRVMADDPNIGVIMETLTEQGKEPIMAQRYLPEITSGDKRILIVNGKPLDYVLARIPKKGEARANLAAGGTGEGQAISERERWIANQIAPDLLKRGLLFVGIDVIGDFLTEINVTCPTCIRELDAQFSLDIAGMLMDAVKAKLEQS